MSRPHRASRGRRRIGPAAGRAAGRSSDHRGDLPALSHIRRRGHPGRRHRVEVRTADPRAGKPRAPVGRARRWNHRSRGERPLAGTACPEMSRSGRLRSGVGRRRVGRAGPRRDLDRSARPRSQPAGPRALARRAAGPARALLPEGRDRSRLGRGPRGVRSRRTVYRRAVTFAAATPDHAVRGEDAARRGAADLRARKLRVRSRSVSGGSGGQMGALREGLIDLAAARLGGNALLASDEFFAPKSNLLEPGRGVFIEGRYTKRGKWMDGWETRRRRGPGYDWCIIRLGAPGVIRALTVDTNHFRGNHPAECSLDAVDLAGAPTARRLHALAGAWWERLPRAPLAGHTENDFSIRGDARATHVRLNIYPDGGVARLRVWGEARPDWRRITAARRGAGPIDLVAVEHGGLPLATSDQFFSEPLNLIMPGRPRDLGDGWETRRRRGPGHDWVVLRLGRRGVIERVDLDTTHFKGNFPESASLEGCDVVGRSAPPDDAPWRELVARTTLRANARHRLAVPPGRRDPLTHVRLNIFPDGGVARLRVWGRVLL